MKAIERAFLVGNAASVGALRLRLNNAISPMHKDFLMNMSPVLERRLYADAAGSEGKVAS